MLRTMSQNAVIESRLISLVVPVFNEEDSLQELLQQVSSVMSSPAMAAWDWEMILVDDGSTDASWVRMSELRSVYSPHIRALRLRRNFGKAVALAAGFSHAQGAIVVTMDADLQDDPVELPRFIEKLNQGYDVVSGWKRERHDPLHKTLPSRLFNTVTGRMTGIKIHDFNCGFKAYRRAVLAHIDLYGELHRYIPVLVHARGFRVTEIVVHHRERVHGHSKYGSRRLIKGFLDLFTIMTLTRYGQRPGHLFGGMGVLCGFSGTLILSYLTLGKILFNMGIGSRPLFFLGILLMLLGAQLLTTGLLGELVIQRTFRRNPEVYIDDRL